MLYLSVWSEYQGLAEVKRLNGEIYKALNERRLPLRSALDVSRGYFRTVLVAADTAIRVLDFAPITATAAAVTVTLPANPEAGYLVMVSNMTQRRDHRIAVGSTPVKVQDAGGFILIDTPSFTVTLKYIGPVYGWKVL